MTKTTLNNFRQKTAWHSGISPRILLAGLLFMLPSLLQPAWSQAPTIIYHHPGQYRDFDENKLEIVITPDYFPIIWHHVQKYGIDYADTTNVISCVTQSETQTTVDIYFNCPDAAMAAGAEYVKMFSVPGYGTVTVYYNSALEAIGSGADLDSDNIGDSQDDDIDGDGVPNGSDQYPRDASRWDDEVNDNDGDGVPNLYDAYPFDPSKSSNIISNTSGAFSVAPNGAATYHFPVAVPPGIAGIAPKLSLNYNSQGGNGLLGLGWSLGGFSSIHRCPATIAQDGFSDGVDFDSNDRFCLDEQRLVLAAGTYGANLSEYRTEIDSFQKIMAYGDPLNGTGYFKVWTPTGEVMEFGNSANSPIMAQGKLKAYIWVLNKVTDASGNIMTFTYGRSEPDSEYWPTRIDYAWSGGSSHASVEFEYGTRNDIRATYMAGSQVRQTKLLTKIKTFADTSPVMEYVLSYGESPVDGRKRVRNIIPCSLVTSLQCQEPVRFDWQGQKNPASSPIPQASLAGTASWNGAHWITDLEGDGRQDLLFNKYGSFDYYKVGSSTVQGTKQHTIAYGSRQWTVDTNGDGLLDLLYLQDDSNDSDNLWLMKNTGNGLAAPGATPWGVVANGIAIDNGNLMAWPADINGDGRTDLVYNSRYLGVHGWYMSQQYDALISQADGSTTHVSLGSRTYDAGLNGTHFTIDVNGDGATDLVYSRAGSYEFRVLINNQNNTFTETHWADRSYNASYNYAFWPMDVNGDSLVDMVYYDSSIDQYRVLVNKGNGTAQDTLFGAGGDADYNGAHWILDTNGDGIMDLVYREASGNKYYRSLESRADGSRENVVWLNGHSYSAAYNGTHWAADIAGNGMQDLLFATVSSTTNTTIYYKIHNNSKFELINKITDGFGQETSIAYTPVSEGIVSQYSRYQRTQTGYGQYPVNTIANGAMQVVSQVSQPDGIAGTRNKRYYYKDLKVDRRGRGLLGFREMVEEDVEAGTVDTTTFSQDFPNTGLPVETRQEIQVGGNKVLFNKTTTQYQSMSTLGAAKFVYPGVSTEYSYHFDNTTSTSSLLATNKTTNASPDLYGNFQTVTVEIDSADGTQHYKTVTNNQYENRTSGQWLLGLLRRATVTKYKDNLTDANSTRVTAFEYDTNGLLAKETVEPDRVEPFKQVTVYARDSYGNIIATTACATDFINCTPGAAGPIALPFRTTTTTYDTRGQYPEAITNALGQNETRTYEPNFGQMLTLTGPNGLTTEWQYNSFGQKTKEIRADGTQTVFSYQWCGTGCPTFGKHYVVTQSTGQSPVIEYFDAFDRKLRVRTTAFDGGNVYTDTVYNALGQTEKVSEPYFSGNTVYWTQSEYDLVGRIITVTPPAGPVIHTDYNGFSNTTRRTVNGQERIDTETKNVVGQTTSVTNAAGTILRYTYDSQGNLTDTWVESRPDTNIHVDFDVLGRKTAMDDPDMGSWTYQYNGYGELVSQTNGMLQTVSMKYDKLGRMTERTEPEGVSTWTYGDLTTYSAGNRNIGKLIEVSGPGNSMTKTIDYDGLGRPTDTTTTLTVAPYITQQQYVTSLTYYQSGDHLGKVQSIKYPLVNGTRFEAKQNYNQYGYLESVTSPNGLVKYWEGIGTNARGQFTNENLGDHVLTMKQYDEARGWITRIQSMSDAPGVGTFQDMEYDYDDVGNVNWRTDHRQTLTEHFLYDSLDQITDAWVVGGTPAGDYVAKHYDYDELGNLTFKTGVGHYKYGTDCATAAGPHAVCEVRDAQTGGNLLQSYAYNNNGSMTTGNGRTVSYTSFNKPYQFNQNGNSVTFQYGAERARVFKLSGTKKTVYIGLGATGNPLYEHEMDGSVEKHLHFIYAGGQALAVYTVEDNAGAFASKMEYLHRDHLGSVEVVSDDNGVAVAYMSFDAWGQQRDADWSEPTGGYAGTPGNLGYTGHEGITEVGLIHMNGRVYDPVLGKFLSADPNVQFEKSVTAYNRYSYVSNNPLKYTDPSGYFLKKLLQHISPKLASIISIALNVFLPLGIGTGLSMMFNTMYAAANGASAGQIAFSAVLSIAGSSLGGKLAGKIGEAYKFTKDAWQYTMIQGSVSGAFTGGVNAAVGGGNIRRGILQGAASGAALSGIQWKMRQSLTHQVTQPDGTTDSSTDVTQGDMLVKADYKIRQGQYETGAYARSRKQLIMMYGKPDRDVIVYGVRPLDMDGANTIKDFDGILADQLNIGGIHEEAVLITKNGNVITRGFHGGGKGYTSDPKFDYFLRAGKYRFGHSQPLSPGISGLDILNQVGGLPRFTDPDNYNFITNNCQDYCAYVRGAVLRSKGI